MMKKALTITLLLMMFSATLSYAHPPKDIEMQYDQERSIPHVAMVHISRDFYDHYIRKIVVYKNDKEIKTVANHKQINPKGFEKEISLEAEAEDSLLVKIYCSDGGVGTAALIVEENTEKNGK